MTERTPIPRIVVYEAADAPTGHGFCGRFFLGWVLMPKEWRPC